MQTINVLSIERISAEDRAKIEAVDPAIQLTDAGGWYDGEIRETWPAFASARYLAPGATGAGSREERSARGKLACPNASGRVAPTGVSTTNDGSAVSPRCLPPACGWTITKSRVAPVIPLSSSTRGRGLGEPGRRAGFCRAGPSRGASAWEWNPTNPIAFCDPGDGLCSASSVNR